MLNARNGCGGVTSGSTLGYIHTTNCLGNDCCDGCNSCNSCGSCNSCDSCGCSNQGCGCPNQGWGCSNQGWGCSTGCGYGSRFARSLAAQLQTLYNTRVHITTFTCTLDVVLLDVCCEFIRVLDFCSGKIFLLRIDCICMIEQPIVPTC